MRKYLIPLSSALLALTACSEAGDTTYASEDAATESGAMAEMAATAATGPDGDRIDIAAIPSAMPRLAYSYALSFTLAPDDIGTLMHRHADLCEKQGPLSCRIVGMDLSGSAERGDIRGTLQLAVAASHARSVSALLEKEATVAGAEQTATTIASEEVSKTIVDTEARIRARAELRDRLMEVLRTRKGKVSELVEAERQVAAVNEEIDQAKSWLAETKGRVAFSQMAISYEPQAAMGSGFVSPIAAAFGKLGTIFGYVVALLMVLGVLAAPVAGVLWAGRRLNRRHAATMQEG